VGATHVGEEAEVVACHPGNQGSVSEAVGEVRVRDTCLARWAGTCWVMEKTCASFLCVGVVTC